MDCALSLAHIASIKSQVISRRQNSWRSMTCTSVTGRLESWKVGKYSRSWKALLLGWQRTWQQHRFDWLETLWTPSTLSLYNLHPARSASAQNLDFCKLVFALFLEILVSMQAGSWRCSRLPKHVQTWSMQPPSHLFSSKKKRVEPWPGDVAFLVLHLKFLFDARLSCEQSHLSFPELVSQWKSFPALQGIVRARC